MALWQSLPSNGHGWLCFRFLDACGNTGHWQTVIPVASCCCCCCCCCSCIYTSVLLHQGFLFIYSSFGPNFFPKQVYLWGSILEKKRLDTLVGALCCVGRGFGRAGRAGRFGSAWRARLGWARNLAMLGVLGWVGRGVWLWWARWAGLDALGWLGVGLALLGVLCCVGRGFGRAGRAALGRVGRRFGSAWRARLGGIWPYWARWAGLGVGFGSGALGWVGRGVWPCWARCWVGWGLALVAALCCVGLYLDLHVYLKWYHGAWAKQSLASANEMWFWAILCSKNVMWSERNGSERRETAVAATNTA